MNRTPTRLTGLTPALLAFVLYGGWALNVNWPHGESHALAAFLVQGMASFVTTLILTRLIEFLYARLFTRTLKLMLTPLASIGIIGLALYWIHALADTPSILPTITPSLLIGFAYCAYCTFKLDRMDAEIVK